MAMSPEHAAALARLKRMQRLAPELYKALRALAMLVLQSSLYDSDPDAHAAVQTAMALLAKVEGR